MTETDANGLLLNLGCGSNFDPRWTNLDLVPCSAEVIQADLDQGIPYADESADAVYHSHVLEHLPRVSAEDFVAECFRVLKPGGVLRIAVPDLEQIARVYLSMVETAWTSPSKINLANHQWMQLEMLDQIVRTQSGGEMGRHMIDPQIPNADFVEQRLGREFSQISEQDDQSKTPISPKPRRLKSWWNSLRKKIRRKLTRLVFGKTFLKDLDTLKFRQSGEVHQWMYDRVSLRRLMEKTGFTDFCICSAVDSRIQNFVEYNLDSRNGQALKPDSIFVEAVKPGVARNIAA